MNYPLIRNNIIRDDLNKVISHLKKKDPILTSGKNVYDFEKKWSKWLGVKYSIFVNSGSSANLLSISVLKDIFDKGGEIIVPALTWSSDISSIILNGFTPVFVDINLNNLSACTDDILNKINKKTIAVFLTHAQGFNGLDDRLLKTLKRKKIILIEDVCESHGAKFKDKKLGNFGFISNFSFYYAHHMSTIEGGMICTNNKKIYNQLCMLRGHGLLRESKDTKFKNKIIKNYKELNKDFIFMNLGFNVRNNEIGGIIGINQLKRLNNNIKKRTKNFIYFNNLLDKKHFFTDFDIDGSSNYAFNIILSDKNEIFFDQLTRRLRKYNIEYRIGSAGGGNQLRQPYIKKYTKKYSLKDFPNTEHVHFFGMYIGNYPDLKIKDIEFIAGVVNGEIK